MAITRARAVKLLSATEFKLYEATRRGRIDDHGAKRLSQMLTSAKRLQDKYGEQAKAQAAKGRKGAIRDSKAQAVASANTQAKQEIFTDILGRLHVAEQRALARAAPQKPKARPKVKKAAKKAAKKATVQTKAAAKRAKVHKKKAGRKATKKILDLKSKVATQRTATQAKSAPKGQELQRKGNEAAKRSHMAHSAARGKRVQAKRDQRGR